MKLFDVSLIPFSFPGSYMAVSYLNGGFHGAENEEGLYLRTIHSDAIHPEVCRLEMLANGKAIPCTYDEKPDELVMKSECGAISLCFMDEKTLLIKGTGKSIALSLKFCTDSCYNVAFKVPVGNREQYCFEQFANSCKYYIYAEKGSASLTHNWDGEHSRDIRFDIQDDEGEFLLSFTEACVECENRIRYEEYEEAKKKAGNCFAAFLNTMPEVPGEYMDERYMAAYIDWESVVNPCGFLTKKTMLMSKNWMKSVWSWDHCFNAIALSYHNSEEAWNQFILMFDRQDASGRIPDSVNDAAVAWNYCKPPIHGWALGKMLEHMTLTRDQMLEAYRKLSLWTEWWMNFRDSDRNGLCEYYHGNDSGWDNSTAFIDLPPVESPDLQAFLILQMDMLGKIADAIGYHSYSLYWKNQSGNLLTRTISYCFGKDGSPLIRQAYTGKIIENDSLLPYIAVILGDKLPEKIRNNIVSTLKSEKFMTKWGLATECPVSSYYRSDGYWRGPIWAPSTMLLADGLERCGEREFARKIAEKFAEMIKHGGCAENFDALTGTGLRDRAYTWTASVFLVLCHDYLME